jgi:hypothetical protein
VSGAHEPSGSRGWPLIRLNALAVAIPTNCRKLVCMIEGIAAVRAAVAEADARLIVTRTQAGVLGFGSDTEFRRVFDPFGITAFDLATFEHRRLRYESGERGLLRDALVEALCAAKNVRAIRRRNADLLVPVDPADTAWDGLRAITRQVTGTVPEHPDLHWHEGVAVRLDWADDRLWLLLDPKIMFEGVTDETKVITADFARERTVKRYNRDLDRLIDFWAKHLAGDALPALSIGDGIDARFAISENTAFSKLIQP